MSCFSFHASPTNDSPIGRPATMPAGTVMQLQDRAYTSPIWYTP